ncbi:hypothetical protein M501DRAFT_1019360, partial [Patellaria atrata CBS 101060]
MTCNITNTPHNIEPLPLYRRHAEDPETASILSSAPSYVSEAPTYTSRRTSSVLNPPAAPMTQHHPNHTSPNLTSRGPPRQGLPAANYAPGFTNRAHGSVGEIEAHMYNISHWSSITTSANSRQYHAVARRRVNQATTTSSSPSNTAALLNSLTSPAAPVPSLPSSPSSSDPQTRSGTSQNALQSVSEEHPSNPLEDPYLVGEQAAKRARQQRIYREMCLRGDQAVRNESKAWDFMVGQMEDWEERERAWRRFRGEARGKG